MSFVNENDEDGHGEDLMLGQAVARFKEEFGYSPAVAAFAPGRVNLIGEHVDYNSGYVLPFALPFRTIIVGSRTPESVLATTATTTPESGMSGKSLSSVVVSCNVSGGDSRTAFAVDGSLSIGQPTWANYVKGTVFQYVEHLPKACAFHAVYQSDVPIGSGLSSSASLEVATATFLEELYNLKSEKQEKDQIKAVFSGENKALRCQKAEHDFAGMPCGIMDQFVSSLGQEGRMMLIDCESNTYKMVGMGSHVSSSNSSDHDLEHELEPVMIVCNSNVKHSLSSSEYPIRVKQCKEAVAALQQLFPQIRSLRDATLEQLSEVCSIYGYSYKSAVGSAVLKRSGSRQTFSRSSSTSSLYNSSLQQQEAVDPGSLSEFAYRRAYHCITENIRTLQAVDALKTGDYVTLGKLMTASHYSLQYDFDVSCSELNMLVQAALKMDGVYGSRMTGGGFGGCTITLVRPDMATDLMQYFTHIYPLCDCYVARPSAGAGLLNLETAICVNPGVSRYGDDLGCVDDHGDNDAQPFTASTIVQTTIEEVWESFTQSKYAVPSVGICVAVAAVIGFVITRKR